MKQETKITHKRTHLVFKSIEDKRKAEDFLLAMKYNFSGIVRKPILTVATSKYKKGYLDLYLPEHIGITTFNFKTN